MDDDESLWSKVACRLLMNVVTHPIDYARVLIQIGHEPMEPFVTRRLLGQTALGLPNVFQYIKFIKRKNGLVGCYQGIIPKVYANTVYMIVYEKTSSKIDEINEKNQNKQKEEDKDEKEDVKRNFLKSLCCQIVATVLSHPLEVVAVRMMAQFVGNETKYNMVFGSVIEIYRANGVGGYFSGIVPKLVGELSTFLLVTSISYAVNKHIVVDNELKPYTSSFISFFATTITYPFNVVSQCMIVSNSGLAAGAPPLMPVYRNWMHCWSELSKEHQLNRGSSLLWRYKPIIGEKKFR